MHFIQCFWASKSCIKGCWLENIKISISKENIPRFFSQRKFNYRLVNCVLTIFHISPLVWSVNSGMAIFPIFCDFEWKLWRFLNDFTWNHRNHWNWESTGFHNLKLKGSVIPWNAKICSHVWIFHECEYYEPYVHSFDKPHLDRNELIWEPSYPHA